MKPSLRRWIALLALLFLPASLGAALPLCAGADEAGESAMAPMAMDHHGGHGHHASPAQHAQHLPTDGGNGEQRDGPSVPLCPLGMTSGAASCLGGFVSAVAPRVVLSAVDGHAFLAPVQPRDRIFAVSLFHPPRA